MAEEDWTAAFIAAQGDLTLPELAAKTGVPLRSLANYRAGTIPRAAQYERLLRGLPGLPEPPKQARDASRASLETRVRRLEGQVRRVTEAVAALHADARRGMPGFDVSRPVEGKRPSGAASEPSPRPARARRTRPGQQGR